MKSFRASFGAPLRCAALIGTGLLLGATGAAASPISVGTFEVLNDTADPFFAGPTFLVTNDSAFAGLPVTFGNLHLVFDLIDLSSVDFALTGALAPSATIDSNGLTDGLGQSLLPDLSAVVDAYLTLSILDPTTSAALAGIVSFGPSARMTELADGSTRTIQFDPSSTGPAPVPEPMSIFLVGGGLAVCAVKRRRSAS
jgi:hypothetical protein